MHSLIYLMYDNGMDTGETFVSYDELEQWAYDLLGSWPEKNTKRAMRTGDVFVIGSRGYKCELRPSHSLTASAA